MKQNIIIVTVLAALSMVNGIPLHKRATTFGPCPAGSPIQLTVTMDPDPPTAGGIETFTISGTPTAEITEANLVFSILDETNAPQGDSVTTPFCTAEGITCPAAAGTAFTAKQPVTMAETLPPTYQLQVELVDATGTIGCSVGTVTGAAAPADGAPADGDDGGDDGAEPPADGDDGAEPPADDAPADDGAPADDAPADDGAPADDA